MNSKNSKTSKAHVLILRLTDKLHLKRGEKIIVLSYLSIYYAWKKYSKTHTTIINLKCQLQHEIMNLNYQMNHG